MPLSSMARNVSTRSSVTGLPMAASPTNAKASEGRVSEKATTSAPVPLRISRREGLRCKFMTATSSNGSARDRAHDGGMGAATAKVRLHMASNLFVRRVRRLVEESLRLHHHAGNAVTALGRLFDDKSLLKLARLVSVHQAFKRGDLAIADRRDRQKAGERRAPVDMDHAGTALSEPAAEARAVQFEIVPENVKKRRRGIGDFDLLRLAIDVQRNLHGLAPSCRALAICEFTSVHCSRSV